MLAAVFCAALALCALLTKPHALSWNDASRWATVEALTARHTFAIDGSRFAAATEDKYRYRGATYSDKPPLLALQGAAVAALLAPLGIALAPPAHAALYLITLLTVGVWFALGCAYAYAFQRLLGFGRRAALGVAALSALGTLALPYATVFANHVPAGAAGLAAFYHLARARHAERGLAQAGLGGLFAALAFAFDASAVVVGLGAVILLWGAPARQWLACGLAGAPLVAAQLAFDARVSGGLGPPALNQASWSDPHSPFHRADRSLTFFSSASDYARYAAYLLIGDKGLFSYTPLMLVSAYGLVRMGRAAAAARRIALAAGATLALYFGLMVAFTNDYGALNYGQRRYVDLFFVLGIALGPALAAVRGAALGAVRAAIAASIALAALGVLAPFGGSPGESGLALERAELAHLAARAPLQVALDAAALALTILLAVRFSWTPAAPTSDSGPRGA